MSESDLRTRVVELMPQAREELSEIVAIRSVADPRQFSPEECTQAATWVADRFAGVGFDDIQLEETADGSSAVVGSRPCGDCDAPTVLLYARYDVQPPLNLHAWRTPRSASPRWTDAFCLTEVDGRWYGRGAADCQGNLLMHLTALRALGDELPVHLKLVVEGSEERPRIQRHDRSSIRSVRRVELSATPFARPAAAVDREVEHGEAPHGVRAAAALLASVRAALTGRREGGVSVRCRVDAGDLVQACELLVPATRAMVEHQQCKVPRVDERKGGWPTLGRQRDLLRRIARVASCGRRGDGHHETP
jgi:hypothetical protein